MNNVPSLKRLLVAGLAGGLVLNLVDTPWSVAAMVPYLAPFNAAHGLVASPLTGPWFLLTHFVFCFGIAWVYALAAPQYGPGARTALAVGGGLLVLNRMFGLGNVLLGWIPLYGFLGFSVSFVAGVLGASVVIGRVLDRVSAPATSAR
jgi:hypothetical protein